MGKGGKSSFLVQGAMTAWGGEENGVKKYVSGPTMVMAQGNEKKGDQPKLFVRGSEEEKEENPRGRRLCWRRTERKSFVKEAGYLG